MSTLSITLTLLRVNSTFATAQNKDTPHHITIKPLILTMTPRKDANLAGMRDLSLAKSKLGAPSETKVAGEHGLTLPSRRHSGHSLESRRDLYPRRRRRRRLCPSILDLCRHRASGAGEGPCCPSQDAVAQTGQLQAAGRARRRDACREFGFMLTYRSSGKTTLAEGVLVSFIEEHGTDSAAVDKVRAGIRLSDAFGSASTVHNSTSSRVAKDVQASPSRCTRRLVLMPVGPCQSAHAQSRANQH